MKAHRLQCICTRSSLNCCRLTNAAGAQIVGAQYEMAATIHSYAVTGASAARQLTGVLTSLYDSHDATHVEKRKTQIKGAFKPRIIMDCRAAVSV